jgi:hypothetical protein
MRVSFYSVPSRTIHCHTARIMTLRRTAATAAPLTVRAVIMVAFTAVAGCATMAPPAPAPVPAPAAPVPANREPPAPKINLSGFPLPYRQGYADGCASAGAQERKDAGRFTSDPNYRTGWQDGVTLCRKK